MVFPFNMFKHHNSMSSNVYIPDYVFIELSTSFGLFHCKCFMPRSIQRRRLPCCHAAMLPGAELCRNWHSSGQRENSPAGDPGNHQSTIFNPKFIIADNSPDQASGKIIKCQQENKASIR